MKVGLIGTGARAAVRERAVKTWQKGAFTGRLDAVPAERSALVAFLEQMDAVFVTMPTASHFRMAEAAMKQGVHVFLDGAPATSITECQAIIGLSEEAGVEVGVSRPLRFHPTIQALPVDVRASLILAHRFFPLEREATWPRWLADAVDLCCALAQSSSVQRIDAEAVRSTAAWPDAVAFGLRFHSGTYAQVSIRRRAGPPEGALYVAGSGFAVEMPLGENDAGSGAYVSAALIEAETQAFLHALADQHAAPVSILDGLHTMRLVERLMKKLR